MSRLLSAVAALALFASLAAPAQATPTSRASRAARARAIARQPLPENYRGMTAREKQQVLFGRVEATAYEVLPDHNQLGIGQVLHAVPKLLPWNLRKSFDHKEDTMPPGASQGPKIVHTYATVVPLEVAVNGRKYNALGRFSLAVPPRLGFTPGVALKLLRDGDENSINLHLMNSPVGQGENKNFFALTFRNHFEAPTFRQAPAIWAMGQVFRLVKRDINFLPIPPALIAEAGLHDNVRNFELLHTETARGLTDSRSTGDYRNELAAGIKPGMVLSRILVDGFEVGTITASGTPVASLFGDNYLFFSHQR